MDSIAAWFGRLQANLQFTAAVIGKKSRLAVALPLPGHPMAAFLQCFIFQRCSESQHNQMTDTDSFSTPSAIPEHDS